MKLQTIYDFVLHRFSKGTMNKRVIETRKAIIQKPCSIHTYTMRKTSHF